MANKPKFIDKFWPVSTIVASRTGQYKRVLSQRIERNKHLIENVYGVKADKVVDIFIKAYLSSDKDYPAPIDAVQNPQSTKDFDLYNQYILFLWEYYVKDKSQKPKQEKEVKPKDVKPSKVEQNKEKNESLVLYEGTKEEDLVDEQIDERILKLLGIQDVFDIDYGTYLSLLKERLVTISLGDKKIPREEQMLLQEEFRRVKGKVGRFKIKSKKINAENIGTGPIRVSRQQFFLAGKVTIPDVPAKAVSSPGDDLRKNIEAIKESLNSIVSMLSSQNKLIQKEFDSQRKLSENLKRSQKESGLEKGVDKIKNFVSKVLSPVRGILDNIMNFIVMTLLGRLMYKFLDWIGDKNNKKKIDTLIRFIGDWWPALLAGFILFATPLGAFIRTIVGTVAKLTYYLAKNAIPKLARWVKGNPVAAALVLGSAAAAVGAYTATQQVDKSRRENKKNNPSTILPEDTAKTGKGPGSNQLMNEQIQSRGLNMFRGGGLIPKRKITPPIQPIGEIGYAKGGEITSDTGVKITGAGKDTQLIAAQPGEVVISKAAVEKYGANFFLGLNKSGGGTNVPKMVNNIQLAAGGGMVGGVVPSEPIIPPTRKTSALQYIPPRLRKPENDVNLENKPTANLESYNIDNRAVNKSKESKPTASTRPTNLGSNYNQSIVSNTQVSTPNIPNIFNISPLKYSMEESARESAQPIEQRMPFIMPMVNNIVAVIEKIGQQKNNVERRNINITPNVKQSYIPEPPSTSKKPNMVVLPPLQTNSGGVAQPKTVSAQRDIEDFPVFIPNDHRKTNIQIYGIAGVT